VVSGNEPNLLEHVKDDTIWKVAGAVVTSLFLGLVGLIRLLYHRDQKKIGVIFKWKDETVDPALREFPERYVLQKYCDRRHDELMGEMKHVRRLLERHLGVNGNGPGT